MTVDLSGPAWTPVTSPWITGVQGILSFRSPGSLLSAVSCPWRHLAHPPGCLLSAGSGQSWELLSSVTHTALVAEGCACAPESSSLPLSVPGEAAKVLCSLQGCVYPCVQGGEGALSKGRAALLELQRFLLHAWPQSWPIPCHSLGTKGTGSSRALDRRPGDAAELGKRKSRGLGTPGVRHQRVPESVTASSRTALLVLFGFYELRAGHCQHRAPWASRDVIWARG